MIQYLPKHYSDELFFSMVVRYLHHTDSKAESGAIDLYGTLCATNTILPRNIDRFVENVRDIFSVNSEYIINHHTVYPVIEGLWSKDQSQRVFGQMRGSWNENDRFIYGLEFNKLKYCSRCAQEDKETIGEAYWHRIHNIPFVLSCVKHNCLLNVIEPVNLLTRYAHQSSSLNSVLQREINVKDPSAADHAISKADKYLVSILKGEVEFNHGQVKNGLIDKGFFGIRSGDGLNRTFWPTFMGYIKSYFNPYLNFFSDRGVVPRILNNANGNIPFYAFPLLKFFVEDQPVIETNLKVKCINRHCPQYNFILSEESWLIYYKRGSQKKIKATCPACCFSYIRDIIDDTCIQVVGYGKIIKQLVRNSKNKGESLPSIALKLTLSSSVVERILSGEYDRQEKKRKDRFEKDKKYHREIWKKALESPDFFSLRELSKSLKNTWQWLQRHDSIWLNKTNGPYRWLRRKDRVKKPVDVDGIMLKKLETIYDKMLSEPALIQRSKNRFLDLAKGFHLRNDRLLQLPRCREFIDQHAESNEDFRKRKILDFILTESAKGSLPTLGQVLKKFNSGKSLSTDLPNDLIEFIQKQLNEPI